MALPAVTTRTLTGTYVDARGSALTGHVELVATSRLEDPGDAVILPTSVRVALTAAGSFSVVLPCTDDADLAPVGEWVWTITEYVPGGTTWSFELPYAATAIDITEVTKVDRP